MTAAWLYGNKTHRAPVVGLLAIAIWIVYDIHNAQWPLLLPCGVNTIITLRNYLKMRPQPARGSEGR